MLIRTALYISGGKVPFSISARVLENIFDLSLLLAIGICAVINWVAYC